MKNTKTIIRFIILLCMIQGFNPVFGQEDLELPEVMLPSPTAFQMTKYGDVPINESSGKISPSIPIHTYKAGKLQLPISLGYVGNGVKVDDIAGWTGINWSLNAGGVITRIVRDYKDEYSHLNGYRVLYDQSDLQNMELVSLSDDAIQLNIIESRKTYDTEADLFNFSFAGYSGSFYLNEEFEEVLTNYDNELKIKCYLLGYDDEKQRIEITTPDGIIYYFGGDNATEQTKDSPGSDRAFSATTSYYLTKIVHPTGDEINLTYIDEGDPYFVRQSLSHHIKKKAPSFGSVNCPELIPSDELNPQQSHLNISRIYNGKHLREISSNRSSLKVKFDSESYNNDYEYRRMLNKIVFTDTNLNKDIKTASLSYYSDSERFFLTQVSFSDAKFKYGMEYNEPESLPERFSYSQDHLGYFNGQSNLTLIPKNESSHFEFMNAYLADREPYFEYATKGSLIKMTYPTGGYTLFEYEAPPVKVHDIRRVHLKSYCGQTNLIPDAKLIDCSSIGGLAIDEEGNKISTFDEDQQIDINLSVKAEGNINHLYKVYVKVIDLERDTETVKVLPLAYMVYTYNEVFTFDLKKDHRYKIEIELDPGTSYGSEIYPVYVNAYLDYIKGYKNVDGLGFRVKGVKNYTDESSEPTIKRYYYRGISEINNEYEESFVNINWSLYEYSSTYAALCSTSSIPGMASFPHMEYHTFSNMKSNTLRTLFSTSDNTLLYDDVTISYGGDNFENGGIQKSFRNTTAYHPQYHFGGGTRMFSGVQRENADMYNKLLRKEVFFNKGEDNQLYKIKENIYNYREFWNFEKSITNMIIKRTYSICEGEENVNNSMKGLSIALYRTLSIKSYLDSVLTNEYINPVPIACEDESSYKKITTKKSYLYNNNLVGLPIETIITGSNKDKESKTKTFYPSMVSEVEDNTGLEASSNYLVFRHILSKPIQIENYLADKKISTQRNIYNANALPIYVNTAKGENPLENRIKYGYDNNNNIRETSKSNDISTSYIWGYDKTLPIAKIENSRYLDIPDDLLSNVQSASDADIDAETENDLRITLDALRQGLPESFVTTYTYDPHVGITSITDPNDKTTYYDYDNFERLKSVKDYQQNILTYNEYKYRDRYLCSITATIEEGSGTITDEGETIVNKGSDKTYEIEPEEGYFIKNVIVGSVSMGNISSYTFSDVNINKTIKVNFERITHTVTVSKSGTGFGHITPVGNNPVYQGDDLTFNIVASEGSVLKDVKVNGESLGAVPTYTFPNVMSDQSISAEFEQEIWTISASKLGNGTISPEGDTTVNYFTKIKYTFTPEEGNHISDVQINGASLGVRDSYTFYNVPDDMSIVAIFERDDHLDVDVASLGFFEEGGTRTFSVESNVDWSISSNVSWLTVTPGTGNSSTTISVSCSQYKSIRSGVITITGGGFTRTVEVNQPVFDDSGRSRITTKVTGNGTITPSGITVVERGADQTYEITPDAGHRIKNVSVDGIFQGAVSSYTFSNVLTNKTIWVVFEPITYTITASRTSNGGTITPLGATTVNQGSSITYNITASTGYYLKDVKVNGVSQGVISGYTFSNVVSNQTIVAEFELESWTITASKIGNGTISPSGVTTVNYFTKTKYIFTPDAGYHIADVLIHGLSKGPVSSHTFTNVFADMTIKAIFERDDHLDVDVSFLGFFEEGGTKTFSIESNLDWSISSNVSWLTITPGSGSNSAIISVKCDPSKGIRTGIITVTGGGFTHTVNVSQPVFDDSGRGRITAKAIGNGTITPAGITVVDRGSDQTYNIAPAAGQRIKDVLVNGISQGAISGYTFINVLTNKTIYAYFEPITYTITASRTSNGGTITPLGAATVNQGSSLTYNIAASTGYRINDVKVNGVSKGVIPSYTFSNIVSNHTIVAEFELESWTITASKIGNGTISPAGVTTVNYFTKTKCTFTPDAGYHIADVLIHGLSKGPVISHTFTNVFADMTIKAIFERDDHLDLNISALGFLSNGGTKTFTISSNINWSISSNVSWLTVTPGSGSNSATINVTCGRSKAIRTGIITITGGGFTRTINVSQPTMEILK